MILASPASRFRAVTMRCSGGVPAGFATPRCHTPARRYLRYRGHYNVDLGLEFVKSARVSADTRRAPAICGRADNNTLRHEPRKAIFNFPTIVV